MAAVPECCRPLIRTAFKGFTVCLRWIKFYPRADGSLADSVASSGQMRCQSSGRSSWRVTRPFVSLSISTHLEADIADLPVDICDKYEIEIPRRAANFDASPLFCDAR